MSGWIKIEKDLEDDPRVLRIAKQLSIRFALFDMSDDRNSDELDLSNACAFQGVTLVCGALQRLWRYADSHAREDDTLDCGACELDELIGIPGFCALMPSDWLIAIDDNTVELPNFHEHNGVEARKRALTNKRVAKHRSKLQRTSVTPCNASSLPDQTRPDLDQTKTKTTLKNIPEAQTPRGGDAASEVFEHWKTTWGHPKAVLDLKRRKRIEARLKDFSATQLCDSISGFANSPWHCGTDPKGTGTVYDGIETLLRDQGQVERGLALFTNPPREPPKPESPYDRLMRLNGGDDESKVIEHENEFPALEHSR